MTPTAMETNNNIDRLLEMRDHPERYSEQEIMDTVNHDDETREFYRSLTQAARARRSQRSNSQPMDVDKAWEQFEQTHLTAQKHGRLWQRVAATVLGVLMMSGIAWATVYTVRHFTSTDKSKQTTEKVATPPQTEADAVGPRLGVADTSAIENDEPVVFDNTPLEQMLGEIAAYYGMTVDFQNEDARNLRFHFVWNKGDGLEKVLEDMSHFESVTIEQTDNRLIVQ